MMRHIILPVFILALQSPAWAGAEEQRVSTCQRLKVAIERYTDKRRAGGSPAQMDAWKRARREKQDQWDSLRCRDLHYLLD